MHVTITIGVVGIEESDVEALKESIADGILQQFPKVEVGSIDVVEDPPEDGQAGKG